MANITLKTLKKNGVLLGEADLTEENSDIYAGTYYWYWYDDRLFIYEYHANVNSYTGCSGLQFLGYKEDLAKQLKTRYYINVDAFSWGAYTKEVVKKVCELCGVEYDENNYGW